jgi:transposase
VGISARSRHGDAGSSRAGWGFPGRAALSNDQYRILAPLIPPAKPGEQPRTTEMRRLLHGLFYVVRTACQWRHLRSGTKHLVKWETGQSVGLLLAR